MLSSMAVFRLTRQMRIRWALAAFLMALPVVPTVAWSQLAPSPDAPPVSTAPSQPVDDTPALTLKLEVNLVDVVLMVKAKDGTLVPHLTKDDCSVAEDKVPQTLKSFTAESDLPLTIGILLDTSGSQQRVLQLEQDTGGRFLESVLRKKDEAFALSFDVNVDLLQDFTNNSHQLSRALNKAEINTAAGNGAAGIPGAGGGTVPVYGTPKGTVLYDAVYLASNEKLSQETGRKAMILLTDGEDEGSDHKIGEAIAAAQKSNAIVYVILIADRGFYGGFGYSGYSAMKKLTEETGGRLIDVGNNGAKLQAAFESIQEELRTQYVATYTPSNTKLDGTFRRIAVECGEGTKVQVRKGYYASPQQQQ
jgi:VWFA-related protein